MLAKGMLLGEDSLGTCHHHPGPCGSRDKQHQCVAPTRRAGGVGGGLGPRAREAPVLLIRPLRKLHEIPAATRPSYGSR